MLEGITCEQAYRTSDGKTHNSLDEAESHQRQLNFMEGLRKLVDEHVAYTEYRDVVQTFVDERSADLLELLTVVYQVDEI